jgi:hypothetical protein
MTSGNDPLKNIQSRIEELEQTISQRSAHIKNSTKRLKEDIQTELSPVTVAKKHPLEATGATFVAGFLLARILKNIFRPRPRPLVQHSTVVDVKPSVMKVAAGGLALELLHAGKELGVTWLKQYIEERLRKSRAKP